MFAAVTIPYLADLGASLVNFLLSRMNEYTQGLPVTDEEGKKAYIDKATKQIKFLTEAPPELVLFLCKKAGITSIIYGILQRVLLPLPVIYLPIILELVLKRVNFWPKHPITSQGLSSVIMMVLLMLALPGAIALFPLSNSIDARTLGASFKELVAQGLKKVYFTRSI
jgi:hypothetical protein